MCTRIFNGDDDNEEEKDTKGVLSSLVFLAGLHYGFLPIIIFQRIRRTITYKKCNSLWVTPAATKILIYAWSDSSVLIPLSL